MASPIISLLKNDEFTPTRNTASDTQYFEYVKLKKQIINDKTRHPFIHTDEVVTPRGLIKAHKASYWRGVQAANWCDMDFEWDSDIDIALSLRLLNRHLCTGLGSRTWYLCYYFYTMELYKQFQPLFEKHKLTEDEYVGVISHIAMMGEMWYDLIKDDYRVVEPMFEFKKYINFHEHINTIYTFADITPP